MRGLALLAAIALAAPPVAAQDQHGTIEIEQVGTVVAPIPQAWTTAGPPRLSVLAPSGRTIPHHLIDRSATRPPITVAIDSVRRVEAGWEVLVRAPAGAAADSPACTTGLGLDLGATRVVLDRVLVEGRTGRDGPWRRLGQDRLFQLGNAAHTQRLTLWWPPSDATTLRLTLSSSTSDDAPDLTGIEIHPCRTSAEDLELAIDTTCRQRGRVLECEGELPDRPIHQLELRTGGAIDPSTPWRLSAGRAGQWLARAEGAGSAGPDRLVVGVDDLRGLAMRFEVAATNLGEPTVIARGPGLVLEILAEEVGRYRVLRLPGTDLLTSRPIPPSAVWHALQPTPAPADAAEVPLGATLTDEFSARWPVLDDLPRGSAAAIELPPEAVAVARADLGDLRLVADHRQVPYRLREVASGCEAAAATGLQPQSSTTPGVSTAAVEVAAHGLMLSAIEIRAPGVFSRPIRVLEIVPERPGVPAVRRLLASGELRCERSDALPCNLVLPLQQRSPTTLTIEIDDHDAAPLADIEVRVQRRRHRLELVHPGGPLALVAGNSKVAAPRYDPLPLQHLGAPTLLQLGPREQQPESSDHHRLFLIGALGVAALVLVLVLRRQLGP
jgi:hypothetical protein